MKVSVIIPCDNATHKISSCLASLRAIDMPDTDYEVIFVGDCSMNGTFDQLQRECAHKKNWCVERLPGKIDSPSHPRNRGVTLAKGAYVYFLDCDDELLPDSLPLLYRHARETDADVVQGHLLADDGRTRTVMNKLSGWNDAMTREQRITAIISGQSTTNIGLIRTRLLRNNDISWSDEVRRDEDKVFLASVLAEAGKIEYLDQPTFINNKQSTLITSGTQCYGARDLRDHLAVWRHVQSLLSTSGVDYLRLQLESDLRSVISAVIFRNRGDIDEGLFNDFSTFVREYWDIIGAFDFNPRYREILNVVRAGDFAAFGRLVRPRLVIAGYDLKFITSAQPDLEPHFDIRFDEWHRHDIHDGAKSRELLDWAELIWCEWLMGNAVWYAANKQPHQRLIIRMHRFELSRDFGEKLRIEQVDAVTAVSLHFFERLLERYPSIPRAKARLLPNYVRVADYAKDFHDERLFTLGMVGILPARKGLDKALDILARLRRRDPRYRLEIFGKLPEELGWIAKNNAEMDYFNSCRTFITENGLEGAVAFHGHSDVKTALAQRKVGFLLSTSDPMQEFPGSESFHVAVADGFAAGGVSLVLHWTGAEYIWPEEFILPSTKGMVDRILSFRDDEEGFRATSERGRQFVEAHYGVEQFADGVKSLFQEVA